MGVIRDMPLSEAQVVDSCFEEDAYESGISLLNHMRTEGTKPRPDHVRILVYLALHPPSLHKSQKAQQQQKVLVEKKSKGRKKAAGAQDDGADMQPPLVHECAAAVNLLHFYTLTMHPVHLLRALPGYKQLEGFLPAQLDPDMHDSAVAKRSLVLARKQDCQDCWTMLREGFITDPGVKDLHGDNGDETTREDVPPVGRHAWLVLKWLVVAFEEDDRQREATASSDEPLFLSQIPQARANGAKKGPLWDCRSPVHVAMYCFEAEGDFALSRRERVDLGSRLLRIMVKLSMATSKDRPFPYLDPTNLVRNVARRVHGLHRDSFDAFCRDTAQDTPLFTIAILFLHLVTAAGMPTTGLFGGDGPQKVRPYARPRLGGVCAVLVSKPSKAGTTSAYRQHMLAKVQLVRAVARSLRTGKEPDDDEWRGAAKSGLLQSTIQKAFAPESGLLGPAGAPVDEELALEAALYSEQLVLLADSLAC